MQIVPRFSEIPIRIHQNTPFQTKKNHFFSGEAPTNNEIERKAKIVALRKCDPTRSPRMQSITFASSLLFQVAVHETISRGSDDVDRSYVGSTTCKCGHVTLGLDEHREHGQQRHLIRRLRDRALTRRIKLGFHHITPKHAGATDLLICPRSSAAVKGMIRTYTGGFNGRTATCVVTDEAAAQWDSRPPISSLLLLRNRLISVSEIYLRSRTYPQ